MPESSDIFDVRRVRRLVELMIEHELTEIDLRQADQRIRLKKGGEPVIAMAPAAQAAPVREAAPMPAAAPTAAPPKADDPSLAVVKSPMVGTFYAAASPDSPPFIKVGDHVGPTSTVCVIEAMKVFNEIPADVSGQVVAVLVENGDPVEYGQALFRIDTKK